MMEHEGDDGDAVEQRSGPDHGHTCQEREGDCDNDGRNRGAYLEGLDPPVGNSVTSTRIGTVAEIPSVQPPRRLWSTSPTSTSTPVRSRSPAP